MGFCKLFVEVADAWRLAEALKGFMNLVPKALGSIGAVVSRLSLPT